MVQAPGDSGAQRVMGLMSGTSLDGVDAAIIETDGETIQGFGPALLRPFADQERACLIAATEAAVAAGRAGAPLPNLAEAARVVTTAHLDAARALLARPDAGRIELIGLHGQTVLHRPERGLSVQLGDAGALADALGVPVVADLRQADLGAGGQGAPLVPVYHAALADHLALAPPLVFLNLGGVANLTWIGPDGALIAFDTGPANGLIDLLVQARGAGRYDADGRIAAAGRVDPAALAALMAAPYFAKPLPKSLDRYDFSLDPVLPLTTEDAAATLVAFTADAVAEAARLLPAPPQRWIVCGGGRHNPVLMAALAARLPGVVACDALGLRGDFIEAEAFAFLARRARKGLPITFPGTTGVAGPLSGGRCWVPRLENAA
ncbi:anhydro-N-acetylmuramic acid kinase [Sphingomonas sp.]|uniref:anhydro-N-acetylmuramic acid kinase n=1 Tax=Sphingomonas sp. TaxID=28214 RepID=UPI0025E61AE3|nr:anhydro-N-acetylmuramic acid kinase [Sphingomonas sp.]